MGTCAAFSKNKAVFKYSSGLHCLTSAVLGFFLVRGWTFYFTTTPENCFSGEGLDPRTWLLVVLVLNSIPIALFLVCCPCIVCVALGVVATGGVPEEQTQPVGSTEAGPEEKKPATEV